MSAATQWAERWQDAIRNAIQGGAFFIAVFSQEYNERSTTYVNEELTLAIEQIRLRGHDARWFIPVRISGEIPDRSTRPGETLRSFQYVDLENDDDWHVGVKRIVSVIKSQAQ